MTTTSRWSAGVRRLAVDHVKPRVPAGVWQRLRRLAGRGPGPRDRDRRLLGMSLSELAEEFGSDKWGVHRYTPHYERHFSHLRDDEMVVIELGIGGYAREREGGASLKMWKWFFPRAQVVGVDIQDKSFVNQHRIQAFQGSQTDRRLLRRIVSRYGAPTIVIDDGSHRPPHVIKSFQILFPMLADGGFYVIEDTQTSYWPEWKGSLDLDDPGTSMALVKRLVDGLNYEEFLPEDYEPTYTDLHIVAVHCYHNLVVIEKGDNREGSNKRGANRKWYRQRAGAEHAPDRDRG
ncbi:MAG: CmcI family methyltransferase [Nocardioides sp.]